MNEDISKIDAMDELQFLVDAYNELIKEGDFLAPRYRKLRNACELGIEAIDNLRPEGYWEACEPDYDREGNRILKRGAHCSECQTYNPYADRYCTHCGSYNKRDD